MLKGITKGRGTLKFLNMKAWGEKN